MLPLLLLLTCASQPQAPPAVLLVTLDTTRADHLGSYGYMLAETPNLDQLAADGTRFARANASIPLTIPSHSTILTGRYPPTHGVRDNGDYVLREEETTLAERLQDAGWATAAFTSAFPTQARWGLDQGFDLYSDPLERLPTQLDWRDERRADEVIDDALATLDSLQADDRPLFVWVHLFDAHWPYEPPEPYKSRHADSPYDGEIAFADSQLGRLLEWWDGHRPDSLVVVTADHGEGLGDGGEKTHGFLLHDGTIRVPLILRSRGQLPGGEIAAGGVEHSPVSHVDIVPTVLDLVGLEGDTGLQGRDLRLGGSDEAYSEANSGWRNLGLAQLHARTDAEGRYTEGGYGRFYPVVGDQVSVVPRSARDGDADALAALRDRLGDLRDPNATMAPDTQERLAALGYVGGASLQPGDVDPRDVIDVVHLSWQARQLMGRGRRAQARKAVDTLAERMGESLGVRDLRAQLLAQEGKLGEAAELYADVFLELPSSNTALRLADLAERMGDPSGAEGWYQDALFLEPNSPEAMAGLVRMAMVHGEAERAEALAAQALDQYPDHAEIRLVQAVLRLEHGALQPALQDATLAVSRLPTSALAWSTLARVHWQLGQPEEAIEELRTALRAQPWDLGRRVELTTWLLEVGRNAEAVRVIEPAPVIFRSGGLDLAEVDALVEQARAALAKEMGEEMGQDGGER